MPKKKSPLESFTAYELMLRCPEKTDKHPLETFMHKCAHCQNAHSTYPHDPNCQIYNKLTLSMCSSLHHPDQIHWTDKEVSIVDGVPVCLNYKER